MMRICRRAARGLALGVLVLLGSGCGRPPQVASHNRELVVSLATAVSARNTGWLESNARLIERRKGEGKISEVEYRTLSDVVARARAGDWKAAEDAVYALREAQEPTTEDLRNVAERKLGPEVGEAPPGRAKMGRKPSR